MPLAFFSKRSVCGMSTKYVFIFFCEAERFLIFSSQQMELNFQNLNYLFHYSTINNIYKPIV